jgi:hypothetical protein
MPPKIKVDVNLAKLSPQTTEALVNDPLDDVEIRNALGSDAKIIPYHELKNYRTMDDLLPKPKDAAMLLYENSPMNGHWVCLTKNKGEISFFDPYGEVVDKQLQYSKYSQQRVEGGADQSLHQLLSTSKLPVFFNDYKYQRDGGDVNTCGRHTINFIRYNQRHGLDLEDYNEMMKKTQKETGMPYDELISKMVPIYLPNPSKGEGVEGGAKPTDLSLWNEVKAYTRTRFPKWSAYASGFAAKIYKERGGKWEDDGKGRPLKRWFKEVWTDVGGKDYPTYRPTKRISKDTPLTASEISPEELAKQAILKQEYKGEKNLPKFKGKGRPLNAPNKTCAEKFLECVKAKKFRKVRGKDERYDPDVKLPEFGVDSFQPHLGKLASLAITGKDNYAAAKKLIEEIEKGSTPDEREKQKEITQEDLRRLKKVKPYRMKSAIKHKYNLARQMEVIGGDELEAAIKRGQKRFARWEAPYDVKGRKDGRIIIEYQSSYDGSNKSVLLPLVFVYDKREPANLYDPEDGADAGLLYVGKKKEMRKGYYGEYETEVNDPSNPDVRLDFNWLRGLHKRQKEEELMAKVRKPPSKEQLAAAPDFDPDADYEATYYPQIRLWYVKDADRGIYYLPESRFPHSAKERKIRVSEQELVEGDDTQYVGKLTEDKKFAVEPEMRKWWAAYKKKHNIQLK